MNRFAKAATEWGLSKRVLGFLLACDPSGGDQRTFIKSYFDKMVSFWGI